MVDYLVHPAKQTPQAAVSTDNTSWAAATLPAQAVYVIAYPTADMHIVCDSAAADPAAVGAVYAAGQTHIIECRSLTALHAKNLSGSSASLYYTVFGN
jgi:hypothetical protein